MEKLVYTFVDELMDKLVDNNFKQCNKDNDYI